MRWNSGSVMCGFSSANSGLARYLANSASQSAGERGGTAPVTGRHSVMLRLERGCQLSCSRGGKGNRGGGGAYPDSVRRVSPPKTTMPKTLAALPRSQYATAREDVSG